MEIALVRWKSFIWENLLPCIVSDNLIFPAKSKKVIRRTYEMGDNAVGMKQLYEVRKNKFVDGLAVLFLTISKKGLFLCLERVV